MLLVCRQKSVILKTKAIDLMKYLPTDVSSFTIMRTGNYLYIDKTEYIYNLFSSGQRFYFLSRPRRFGKSLLISTPEDALAQIHNKRYYEPFLTNGKKIFLIGLAFDIANSDLEIKYKVQELNI